MNGYDGSLFNALTINQKFLDFFDGEDKGPWQARVSAMYQIGGVLALPFVGPSLDKWGRKWGMFIGAAIVVAGTVIQGLSEIHQSLPQFMFGSAVLGFGVTITSAAGPMYVVEVSHPAHRGVVTALYNTFWFVGAIVASSASRGAMAQHPTGTSSWLIPVWLQLLFSGLIVTLVFFLPESPRWLYVNNRYNDAKDMLTKYHGEGNPHSIWVTLQMREYEEFLELEGSDKRWWDYRALFNSRASRYRLFCNVMVSIFGQWAGNAVLSYFQSAVLGTAGLTDPTQKANINLANNFQQFVRSISSISRTMIPKLTPYSSLPLSEHLSLISLAVDHSSSSPTELVASSGSECASHKAFTQPQIKKMSWLRTPRSSSFFSSALSTPSASPLCKPFFRSKSFPSRCAQKAWHSHNLLSI